MDEDVSIINTNTRNEKIKNFFINNKNKLIFVIIILLVGIVVFVPRFRDACPFEHFFLHP